MNSKLIMLAIIITFIVGCSDDQNTGSIQEGVESLVVKCEQKLPEFTLGPRSNPPKEKIDALCNCVWNKLDGWEKSTSIAISEGREKEVSKINIMAFPSRFGEAMESCGAMEL